MKKIKFIYLIAMTLLGLAIFVSCTEDSPSKPISNHTLVFYMMGNGTGLTEFMDNNILALRSVANQVVSETNHIVVFYDRGDVTRISEILVEDGRTKEKIVKQYVNSTNCIDSEFMSGVFQWIDETYASDSYGVVFSSHGGGWVPSNIFDEYLLANIPTSAQNEPAASPFYCGQDGDEYMEIPQMAEALDLSGIHFDYILFDACFMSSIEALYDLRNNADYIIASPSEVLADGFPYKEIIPMLFTKEHKLQSVCASFVDHYKALSGENQSATIALIDCSKLEALAEQVKSILTNSGYSGLNKSQIQGYEGFKPHLYFDLKHYCDLYTNGNLPNEFIKALNDAVPYSAHTEKFYSNYGPDAGLIPITNSCGVSCFVYDPDSPASTKAYQEYLKTNWAKAIGLQ